MRVLTRQEIAKLIGNDSWTSLKCDECRAEVRAVAVYGEEWEDWSHKICSSCLQAQCVSVQEAMGE